MNHSTIGRAYRAAPDTAPQPWTVVSQTGTTYNTALARIEDSATAFVTDLTTGRVLLNQDKPLVQLAFLVSDADNETAKFGIYGVRKETSSFYYTATPLLNGSVTAGTKSFAGGVGSMRWCDTITVTSSCLPSSAYRTCSNTDDVSWLEMDCRDFEQVLVVLTLDGSTGAAATLAYSYGSI